MGLDHVWLLFHPKMCMWAHSLHTAPLKRGKVRQFKRTGAVQNAVELLKRVLWHVEKSGLAPHQWLNRSCRWVAKCGERLHAGQRIRKRWNVQPPWPCASQVNSVGHRHGPSTHSNLLCLKVMFKYRSLVGPHSTVHCLAEMAGNEKGSERTAPGLLSVALVCFDEETSLVRQRLMTKQE